MNNKYLIINAGSSSLKLALYEMPEQKEIVNIYVEKIGKEDSFYTLKFNDQKLEKKCLIANHEEAIKIMLEELISNNFVNSIEEIKGIGHRILHGGEYYSDSVLIDEDVLNNLKTLIPLGPLHQPAGIIGVENMQKILPGVPNVGIFDTAFHQTMEPKYYMYPTPYEWYEEDGVRKYGFHGSSHKYMSKLIPEKYGCEKIINLHVGSGISEAAIDNGKSIYTTMGMTPLEGTMMGTRSGSIDPAIIEYECKKRNMTVEEVTSILNKESGLLGIAGANDYRDVIAKAKSGDKHAQLAMQMFEVSILKFIGECYVILGEVDAIVFTAGIGENNIEFRENIVKALEKPLGIKLDKDANNSIAKFKEKQSGVISTPDSKIMVIVEPTNEELMMLLDTYEIVNSLEQSKTKSKK